MSLHPIDKIFYDLDPDRISQTITGPIREAELSYVPTHVFAATYFQFEEECARYYNYLMRSKGKLGRNYYSDKDAFGRAKRVFDSMFEDFGGWRHAFELMKLESFGAIKSAITQGFISEQLENLANTAVTSTIDPTNYDQKKAVLDEYVRRFRIEFGDLSEYHQAISNLAFFLQNHVRLMHEEKMKRRMKAP